MKQLLAASFLLAQTLFAQSTFNFQAAYGYSSYLPEGILESVSYAQTRIRNVQSSEMESCSGMPLPFGPMGLFDNGKGYFKTNAELVAQLSGIPVAVQKAFPDQQITAYAIAFGLLMQQECQSISDKNDPQRIKNILYHLSEIPDSGSVNLYARDLQVYEILKAMCSADLGSRFGFDPHNFDLEATFGVMNYRVLKAKRVYLSSGSIRSGKHEYYQPPSTKSLQYGPAIWNPAPACNFSSRNGIAVSAITIHTIQGSYSGAISWSQNCSSSVSYHYVVRSSDGQITQMVDEADKAWHVGSENPYTIGYEHEGYVTDPSWYTQAMYENSADLSRDIVNSGYGIPALRTYYGASSSVVQVLGGCTRIKGHQHYPNQTHTDPGINWDWEKYYRLINNNPSVTTITAPTGNFYDSGGSTGNYADDERNIWVFQPVSASSVTLDFTAFSLESNYDYLFIYDGNSINAPLIGTYTGTASPGMVTSSGGSITVEFRSDCGTESSGWQASISATLLDLTPPTTEVVPHPDWVTTDLQMQFTDQDNSGVDKRFFLFADRQPSENGWKANGSNGFVHEDFTDNSASWTEQTGTFNVTNATFSFTDIAQNNSNAYTNCIQTGSGTYLYSWEQTITSTGSNQRAGLHFFCSDPTLPNRGNSYFVYFREGQNKAQIYRVNNDVFTLMTNDTCVVEQGVTYLYQVTYDPQTGWIKVYSNGAQVTQWQDPAPLQSGGSISLRSGGCAVDFDEIRCYRSRNGIQEIAILQNDFRYQSTNGFTAGKAFSVVVDQSDNWSSVSEEEFLIDWTAPELSLHADGPGADIDTTWDPNLESNWIGNDPHSGIVNYELAIGTTSSGEEISAFTSQGTVTSGSFLLTSPVADQVYFLTVRATNAAGLISILSSDGQRYMENSAQSTMLTNEVVVFPNPVSGNLFYSSLPEGTFLNLYSADGKLILQDYATMDGYLNLQDLASGMYRLVVHLPGGPASISILKK